MEKIVIIINGHGGVGKDTLCDVAAKYFKTEKISSITPVKEIALMCGWDGKKDDKSRKFLSDLKKVICEYNDYPTKYLVQKYEEFLKSSNEILFVHIREGKEITKFRTQVQVPSITLLIKRSNQGKIQWGNTSDDDVESYDYDAVFDNNLELDDIEPLFIDFLRTVILEAYRGSEKE